MQLPDSGRLSVRHLAGTFRWTTNSYKFYWLLAILRHLEEEGRRVTPISDLLARMIAAVWYPVGAFRLSFGQQDRLARLVRRVKEVTDLADDATRRTVRRTVSDLIEIDGQVAREVRSLDKYVPFRFLTPWFREELSGMSDAARHARTKELAADSFQGDSPALYCFPDDEHIEIHPRWASYLRRHRRIVGDFCLWNLLAFLQGKNPNVPNIAEKLFRPKARRLSGTPRSFWNLVLGARPSLRCLYSGKLLAKGSYDIDHFVPWSFVSHDLLWNLAPVTKAANRSKSDALPDLDAYFGDFATLQRAGFEVAFSEGKKQWLEDYALLFGNELPAIHAMSANDFRERLRERIAPLMQIAANTGFPTGWIYKRGA